jgi:hypothetical protein
MSSDDLCTSPRHNAEPHLPCEDLWCPWRSENIVFDHLGCLPVDHRDSGKFLRRVRAQVEAIQGEIVSEPDGLHTAPTREQLCRRAHRDVFESDLANEKLSDPQMGTALALAWDWFGSSQQLLDTAARLAE